MARQVLSVAQKVDALIDGQASRGRNAPDVAGMLTIAVGFPCDIAARGDLDEPTTYQVMTNHAWDFWEWHRDHNEQYHATPARAAAHFIAQYRHWCEWIAPRPALEARA